MEVLFRAEMLSSIYPTEENDWFQLINNKWYVIGKETTMEKYDLDGIKLCSISNKFGTWVGKNDTKAIHFSDMLAKDSNRYSPYKDLRIFASLARDGKGGDILQGGNKLIIKFCQEDYRFKIRPICFSYWDLIKSSMSYFFENSKIIGIQE